MNNHPFISRDGFALGYRIKGRGEPVMVIGSSVYYPRLFSEHLYSNYRFVFLDHRGFVRPSRTLQPADYTLDKVLDDIEAARQLLKLEHFTILGHSGHAFMALEYARKYSEHIRNVVLLNSAPTNSRERQRRSFSFFDETAEPERKKQFEKDMAFLAEDIKREPGRSFVHMCIRMGAQSFYDYTWNAASLWEGVYTNMPVIDYLWGEAFGKLNLIESLSHFKKPVFIGLGRHDYLVGPVSLWEAGDDAFPNVKKMIFEQSGHNPMLEEPAAFDEQFIEWMRQSK
ncbi:alpha/beta hydrolase [Bacillus badius]|uniref:alpha/beta fold hydrolase n=1 Tax=Bacillus badius TaxID=1455 RepID=UPI0007B08C9C|nr:alpha/beta hydrolase [Bacillus badius]KZO00516.1 alpha/beta hydrolase [Bacillus badius]MED0668459.1 alpha/beta hydrolase [Bacillus badius]OCS87142.1 alpha/beta hydrolase [Bacillus badius]OVE47027.1 alpha/beta hydrolase [Bacillus badius]TDV98913.1 proline iminopeptidase [Bacillus badius]